MREEWKEVSIPTHPVEGGKWVSCIASIRKNETGEIRRYQTDEVLRDGMNHPSVFNWKENNFSCDCNRELCFERANGNEIENEQCSEGRFSVNLENELTGTIYYREFE